MNRQPRIQSFAVLSALLASLAACPVLADLVPALPGFVVTDFGAVADGKTMNTEAIAKAIGACSAAGGGRVIVPTGTYLTGPIHLASNVDLHLDAGAVILFSRHFEDFPLILTNFEGRNTVRCTSPISGDNLQNVSLTGDGIFDGQGDFWRSAKKDKFTEEQWTKLIQSGGVVDEKTNTWYPSEEARKGKDEIARIRDNGDPDPRVENYTKFRELLRPSLVLLTNCHNVLLNGPAFRNSPEWNIHLFLCDQITVHNVTLYNPSYAQNGDGIDIDSCRNVTMSDSTVYAGDDDICLKSGRDEEGRKLGKPTENVTITNCTVGWGHGAIAIGSEMSGGVRNVTVSNCTIHGTDTGLRFKTTRGRGGVVENIQISNIEMSDIKKEAISFDMYYMVKKPVTEPVSERTPRFRQFHISNVHCEGAKTAIQLRGLPEMPIEQITIENAQITSDGPGEITDAKDITLHDVHIQSSAPVKVQRTVNLTLERVDGVETATTPAAK